MCSKNKALQVYVYYIMTNQAHLIIGTNGKPDMLQEHALTFKNISLYLHQIDNFL